jgi:hypothetical protein
VQFEYSAFCCPESLQNLQSQRMLSGQVTVCRKVQNGY